MTDRTDHPRLVLVTGASGQQGGAVVDALLSRGHRVRALTRNSESAWAKTAAKRGIEIAAGNLTDTDSLRAALEGADTAFLVTTPFEEGVDVETRQGLRFLEAAKAAGLGHLVFSSVANADLETGIPHFESKRRVEEAIEASGINYTIVAPVFFMDNFAGPWLKPGIDQGTLSMALPGSVPLQQIAVKDIGAFIAAVADRGATAFGKRYDIAGDELTSNDVARILSTSLAREIGYASFPPDAMREDNEDLAIMYEWFDRVGYSVDIAALKSEFSDVDWTDFSAWAAETDLS